MRFRAELAILPGGLARDVVFDVVDGRFAAVTSGAAPGGAGATVRLPGVVLPGFANGHSHAFHRALRGRANGGPGGAHEPGTFWTWRRAMYGVAARLDPDSHLALARAVYAEMALAGITAVGEFHYLHHRPGGIPYDDPNAMGAALVAAAQDAGIRLTLLDTCYLSGGLGADGHLPLDDHQRRFGDRDVDAWADRMRARTAWLDPVRGPVSGPAGTAAGSDPGLVLGAAIHSVRAVPAAALATVVRAAAGGPLHVHLSEQVAENEACLAFHGVTPTALLAAAGALGPDTTVVHATHLTAADLDVLGCRRVHACLCPTTERDLADGIGPARALAGAGAILGVGSDQHVVVDLFEEARGLESHERLTRHRRGVLRPGELLAAMTDHTALGVPDAGRLAAGARADLVAVRLDTVRTAGIDPAEVLSAATAADVDTVVVDGRTVVSGGRHVLDDGRPGGVAALLDAAVRSLWEPASWEPAPGARP